MKASTLAALLAAGIVLLVLYYPPPLLQSHTPATQTTTETITETIVETSTTTVTSPTTILTTVYRTKTITLTTTPADYPELKGKLKKLQEAYQSLLANYTSLRSKYQDLEQNYSRLLAELSELKKEVELLSSTKNELEKLINNLKPLAEAYEASREQALSRTAGYILEHPEVLRQLVNWEHPLVKQATLEALQQWSLIPKNALTKIYEWVIDNVDYGADHNICIPSPQGCEWVRDYWKAASETLEQMIAGKRYGDCEDKAILIAAMVKAYSAMSGVELHPLIVWVSGSISHVFTIILAPDGKIAILDPPDKKDIGLWLGWRQVELEDPWQVVSKYVARWEEQGYKLEKVIAVFDPLEGSIVAQDIPVEKLPEVLILYASKLRGL